MSETSQITKQGSRAVFKTPPLVLMVDDEVKNLQVLANILMENGYNVTASSNGADALEMLQKVNPDLILLDVLMPGMDGYETCRRLKEDSKTRDIPVVFLSAISETENVVSALDCGGVDYITKPFNHSELLARVSAHVELKRSRDALVCSEQRLEESNAAKDKLFSIIAHDLRNPFNVLLGYSSMLNENFEEFSLKEQKEYVEEIYSASHGTFKLLENLLQWSCAQKDMIEFGPQNYCLKELTDQVLEILKPAVRKKQIQLESEIKASMLVYADKNMLDTVIRNLVTNAIKFTQRNGRLVISASEQNEDHAGFIQMSIRDNGVGMSKQVQDKLFDITENISSKGTEKESGTGLGLLLCKEFVEKQGGKIWVESEEGKGSNFRFTLPMGTE